MFFDHWQHEVMENDFRRLGEALGIYWDRDNVEALFDTPTPPGERPSIPERVTFPLAFIIKPEFRDTVMNMFGRRFGKEAPGWAKENKEEVVELFDLPKDEFKKAYSSLLGGGMHMPKVV
jgi:hypothetical protein